MQACGQLCSGAPGGAGLPGQGVLSALEHRVLDNEGQLRLVGSDLHKLGAAGRQQAALEQLQGGGPAPWSRRCPETETAAEVALQLNLTTARLGQLEGLLQARGEEDCGACGCTRGTRPPAGWRGALLLPAWPSRGLGGRPGVGGLGRGPLDGFSVFGGSSSSASRPCKALLRSFSPSAPSMTGCDCRPPWRGQGADLADLGATKDRIISEINRLQQGGHRARHRE